MSLARRSIESVAWNSVATMTSMVVLFVRSVLLARWLPVEVFGVYAFAASIVALTVTIPNFGMGGAFLHRAPETEDEDQAAAVHFTLKAIFVLIWAGIMAAGALIFTTGQTRTALLLLTATTAGVGLAQTPRVILVRRVVHRRLALLQLLNVLLSTLFALGLAWQGATLWALLSTDLVTLGLTVFMLYIWRPVWRPHLAWSRPTVRYYLHFGSRNFLAVVLLRALDKVDDLWTGVFLGKTPLGFYSKAYTFATYPRRILAAPINQVASGTYAELKDDRKRLSQAFFRTNAFLIRSGFFLAGLLALIAPEFIRLLLTDKWLPMLDAFRLMLVFTLLDPIKITISHVFVAVGRPEQVMQARFVQLIVLLAGLFLLGPRLGIAGVALAVDAMLVVGIGVLLWLVRAYVDFSLRRLFLVPGLALMLGLVLGQVVLRIPGVGGNDWVSGPCKAVAFSSVYGAILLWLERSLVLQAAHTLRGSLLSSTLSESPDRTQG